MASNYESKTTPDIHTQKKRRLPNNAPQKVHQRRECERQQRGQAVGPSKYAKHFFSGPQQLCETAEDGVRYGKLERGKK